MIIRRIYTSFVIPTYENYGTLADCVQSIKTHADADYEIIIMDNGPVPLGYVDPVVRGGNAARGDLICVVNDDALVGPGFLPPLREAAQRLDVFSPWAENEDHVPLLGWFMCFTKEGWMRYRFDRLFKVWCGDIDVFKRMKQAGHPFEKIKDSVVYHPEYSVTCSKPEIQSIIVPWQLQDIENYRKKWGTDPNEDKNALR